MCILSIGVWALNEKNVFSNVSSKIFLQDPAFFGIILGSIAFLIGERDEKVRGNGFMRFFVGFTGSLGSLRENTFLLSMVSEVNPTETP